MEHLKRLTTEELEDLATDGDSPEAIAAHYELERRIKVMADPAGLRGATVEWSGPGKYWLTEASDAGNGGMLTLGRCSTEEELRAAVREAVTAGTDDDPWDEWSTDKE